MLKFLRVVIQMIMTGGKTKVPMAGHSKTSRNISCVPKEMLFFLATGMEQIPLGVSNLQDPQEMTRAFVQSCQELGLPYNPDFNGAQQEGCGFYQLTVKNSRRCSAAQAICALQ